MGMGPLDGGLWRPGNGPGSPAARRVLETFQRGREERPNKMGNCRVKAVPSLSRFRQLTRATTS